MGVYALPQTFPLELKGLGEWMLSISGDRMWASADFPGEPGSRSEPGRPEGPILRVFLKKVKKGEAFHGHL